MVGLASSRLPVHGFVLAGGKSSRMGVDKALLRFCGEPMVEIAVEKLRGFCAEVWIAGNRDDLARYGRVVYEARVDSGPVAGVEAGVKAAQQPWALFVPVDVPLVPEQLLQRWALAVMQRDGCAMSYLIVNETRQPAFCLIRRECGAAVTAAIERGTRRLADVSQGVEESVGPGALWKADAASFAADSIASSVELERWFANVNTPQDLAEAEAYQQGRTQEGRTQVVDPRAS